MDIKSALLQLDPENNDHWTSDGSPRVDVLQQMLGEPKLTRQQITDADPEFNREKAALVVVEDDENESSEAAPSGPEAQEGDAQQPPEGDAQQPPEGDADDLPPQDLAEPPVEISNEERLRAEEKKLTAELNDLVAERDDLNEDITHLNRKLSALRDQLSLKQTAADDTAARIAYIKSQHKLRMERHARTKDIREALTGQELTGKSPLDQAMTRNTKRGTQRPQRPPQG